MRSTRTPTRFAFALTLSLLVGACDETPLRGVAVTGQLAVSGAAPGALAGQSITLFPSVGGAVAIATTDGDGRFAFARVAAGAYVAQATLGDTVEATRALAVTVGDADVAVPTLSFTGLGTIIGRVDDGAGGAVPAAQVLGGNREPQSIDATGTFALHGVPAGPQIVVAYAPGRLAAVSPTLDVTWRGSSDAGLLALLVVSTTHQFSGQVAWPITPGPVPPILVSVDDGKWQATADAAGLFTVIGVPDGVHSLDFFELDPAPSGAPVPLHNRLPRVLISSGQAFAMGNGVAPLPVVPLYRGRRIGTGLDSIGTLAADKSALLSTAGYNGLPSLLDLDGNRAALATGGVCGFAATGVVCEARFAINGQQAPLARVTFHPLAKADAPLILSDRALWSRRLGATDRVLIAEPGTTATLQSYRVVDATGAAIALEGETSAYYSMVLSASGKRFAICDKTSTVLFDLETGKRLGERAGGSPAFVGERLIMWGSGGLYDLEGPADAPPITTAYGAPIEGSPDGKFLVTQIGGWSGPSTRLVRLADGQQLFERFGVGHFSWSADGTKAYALMEHFSSAPGDADLIAVDLGSGAVTQLASGLRWCITDPTRPAVWLCNDKVSEFAIDGATGTRVTLGHNQTEWFSFGARYIPDGIVVYTRDAAEPYGYGQIDLLKLPSFTVEPIAARASLSGAYGIPFSNNFFVDPAGRRIAYAVDSGGMLEVHDRTAKQTHKLGVMSSNYMSDLVFAAGGALLSRRSLANPALSDLAGIYVTEFLP